MSEDYQQQLQAAAKAAEDAMAIMGRQMREAYESMLPGILELGRLLEEAKPQTMEEYKEAYEELERKYQRLHEAAEGVYTVAMKPQRESGDYRMYVATRALDELHTALWDD